MAQVPKTGLTCERCGRSWPRDPALEVACPHCQAAIGQRCRRPSEHPVPGRGVHAERDRLALEVVDGYDVCEGPR